MPLAGVFCRACRARQLPLPVPSVGGVPSTCRRFPPGSWSRSLPGGWSLPGAPWGTDQPCVPNGPVAGAVQFCRGDTGAVVATVTSRSSSSRPPECCQIVRRVVESVGGPGSHPKRSGLRHQHFDARRTGVRCQVGAWVGGSHPDRAAFFRRAVVVRRTARSCPDTAFANSRGL